MTAKTTSAQAKQRESASPVARDTAVDFIVAHHESATSPVPVFKVYILDLMRTRGVSQRDIAITWGVSESSVSRFLEGLQTQSTPASRIGQLSKLLGRPVGEVMSKLGLAEDEQGLSVAPPPPNAPPLPTISLTPAGGGKARLLLHLEVPWRVVAKMVALL
jgi:transcriptional regulator with XRE-family HTH domain